jgi:hypothetical protein
MGTLALRPIIARTACITTTPDSQLLRRFLDEPAARHHQLWRGLNESPRKISSAAQEYQSTIAEATLSAARDLNQSLFTRQSVLQSELSCRASKTRIPTHRC